MKNVTSRRLVIGGLGALVLLGCEDKSEGKDDNKGDKGDDKPASEAKASPADDAYSMGRKFAFACVFAMLDKADGVARNMAAVGAKAAALGVDAPSTPTKDGAMEMMRATSVAEAIDKKHDDKTGAAYRLGVTLTDLFFGVNLEADVSSQAADAGTHAAKAGVPASVYETQLAAVKAGASDDTVSALNKALDGHFHYKD